MTKSGDGIIETFIPIAADIFLVNKFLDFIGISKQAKDAAAQEIKNVGVFFGNIILGTDNLLLGIFQIIKSSKAEHFSIMFSPFKFAISLLISNFSIVYQLKILMQR